MDNLIFIIGMPRSGTKLLRDIMNNNEQISIPVYETIFIPSLIRKYGLKPNFDKHSINKIIRDIKKSTFYFYAQKDGIIFDESQFMASINYNSLLSIIKYLLQNFAEKKGDKIFWGDKTPSYINEVELLNKSFPKAKFIHIVRDPRDIVISAKNAWGKNIYRVAQRWNNSIVNFSTYVKNNKIELLEIKFEDLLNRPNTTVIDVCKFLNVNYDEKMLILRKSAENIGDAKGAKKVISANKMKFMSVLSRKQIQKIEELAFAGLKIYDYKILYGKEEKQLSTRRLFIYKIFDIINRIIFNFKAYGAYDGLRFSLLSLFKLNH